MTGLERSTPESEGIPSAAVAAFVAALDAEVSTVHSTMLLRHGRVITEAWWHPYGEQRPHSLFSVSKSVTSMAVGLAINEGLFGLDDAVVALLPDDAPATVSPNLAAMRVRHLLTMSTGHSEDTVGLTADDGTDWATAILAAEVAEVPGSRFVYNTGATFLLSAIITRLTGQRLLDYLAPRLFEPLGIAAPTWEQSPSGIDTGGWGLAITTEDMAKFGQLLLQRGQWEGAQLIPAEWVDVATTGHIDSTSPGSTPDWTQGYGYQFWRCRHGAYRADGAFGQFIVVMPEQDAVLVTTGGTGDPQRILDLAWKHLLPAFDTAGEAGTIPALELTPQGGTASGDGFSVRFDDGSVIRSAQLTGDTLTVVDDRGEHSITFGSGEWVTGHSTFGTWTGRGGWDAEPAPLAASAAWENPSTWVLLTWAVEQPFGYRLMLQFDGDEVTAELTTNVAFESTLLGRGTGHLAN
jgi:CubicO group peptidase (beta-lactamase class C family)